jgi:hypothetical protein
MKTIHENNKVKHDAIMDDIKLSEQEKKEKMKSLREEQEKEIDAILTPDQKTKMDAIRKEMKEKRMNNQNRPNKNTTGTTSPSAGNPTPVSQ